MNQYYTLENVLLGHEKMILQEKEILIIKIFIVCYHHLFLTWLIFSLVKFFSLVFMVAHAFYYFSLSLSPFL